jgi:HAD superfamily hydrolase (TIGR01509 family)
MFSTTTLYIAFPLFALKAKPHPEIYHKAAELLNIPPARCIVIEDALPGI